MTISLSGPVLSHQSLRDGDYQESAIVNGLPSWINKDSALWFSDDYQEFMVGSISERGSNSRGIHSPPGWINSCPDSIDSINWKYYDGSSWLYFETSSISVTCSQAKGKNN